LSIAAVGFIFTEYEDPDPKIGKGSQTVDVFLANQNITKNETV